MCYNIKAFGKKKLDFSRKSELHLGVAQLVARYLGVVEAARSSRVTQTKMRGSSNLSFFVCQSRSARFSRFKFCFPPKPKITCFWSVFYETSTNFFVKSKQKQKLRFVEDNNKI